jgi:hypothetical protein
MSALQPRIIRKQIPLSLPGINMFIFIHLARMPGHVA